MCVDILYFKNNFRDTKYWTISYITGSTRNWGICARLYDIDKAYRILLGKVNKVLLKFKIVYFLQFVSSWRWKLNECLKLSFKSVSRNSRRIIHRLLLASIYCIVIYRYTSSRYRCSRYLYLLYTQGSRQRCCTRFSIVSTPPCL